MGEQFFTYGVLKTRPDNDITDGLGLPDPTLLGALAVTWIILYFSLRGGVGGQGKVAYFTAIFPYLVLLTLLVRGFTLPGFEKGLALFFTPKWEKLIEPKVWYAAVTQSFFSLSVGFGSLTTYASFNKFRHPTSRDALIISVADTFTSLLAGTVIFAILGHLAHETGQEVEEVVKSSAGLAFISYPEVLASLPPHHRQEDDHQAVLCRWLCHRCLLRHPWGHVDAGHGRPLRRHHAHPRPCQPRDHRDCLGLRRQRRHEGLQLHVRDKVERVLAGL